MASFPRSEAEVLRLSSDLSAGLRAHPDIFPAPPVNLDEFDRQIAQYKMDHETAVIAPGKAQQGTAAKDRSLGTLVGSAKTILRYVENAARGEAGTLSLVG